MTSTAETESQPKEVVRFITQETGLEKKSMCKSSMLFRSKHCSSAAHWSVIQLHNNFTISLTEEFLAQVCTHVVLTSLKRTPFYGILIREITQFYALVFYYSSL